MLVRTLLCALIFIMVTGKPARAGETVANHNHQSESLKIRQIRFRSAISLSVPERQRLIGKFRGLGFRFTPTRVSTTLVDNCEELVREAYQDEGYFEAAVSSDLIHVSGGDALDLIFLITPGSKYRFTQIRWKGVSLFDPAELTKLFSVKGGEIFTRAKIASGLAALNKMYESRGYINNTEVPVPEIDEDSRTVGFTIDVDEGGEFHFGDLNIYGMREADEQILLNAWKGLRGQVYRKADADKFFKRYLKSPFRPAEPENYTAIHLNERTRTVDYSLHLYPTSPTN